MTEREDSTDDPGLPPMPGRPLAWRELGPPDLAAVSALHALTRSGMPPGAVALDDDPFIAARLGPAGRVAGVFEGDALVAYAMLHLPRRPGGEIGPLMPEGPVRTARVAELDGVGVRPDRQGLGLHRWLLAWRIEAARAAGVQAILCTVSPENPRSLGNVLAAGLHARALVRMPHGALRLVLHRPAAAPEPLDPGRAIDLPLADTRALRSALARGLHGHALADAGTLRLAPPA